jgi:hypothetical protein
VVSLSYLRLGIICENRNGQRPMRLTTLWLRGIVLATPGMVSDRREEMQIEGNP